MTGVNDPSCTCHDTKIGHLDDAMASRLPRDPTDPYSMRFFDRGTRLEVESRRRHHGGQHMTDRPKYFWECDRCNTTAEDHIGGSVEWFASRHYATVHPLYTADAVQQTWKLRAARTRIPLAASSRLGTRRHRTVGAI